MLVLTDVATLPALLQLPETLTTELNLDYDEWQRRLGPARLSMAIRQCRSTSIFHPAVKLARALQEFSPTPDEIATAPSDLQLRCKRPARGNSRQSYSNKLSPVIPGKINLFSVKPERQRDSPLQCTFRNWIPSPVKD